jgi:hypothetical protein
LKGIVAITMALRMNSPMRPRIILIGPKIILITDAIKAKNF